MQFQKTPLEAKLDLEKQARHVANKDPLPGQLTEAFTSTPEISIGKWTIRSVRSSDYALAKDLNSYIYRQMTKRADEELPEPSIEDVCELAFQFTRLPSECRRVLRLGRDTFKEHALAEFGDLDVTDTSLSDVFAAVLKQYNIAMSTMLAYKADSEAKGDVTFFPQAQTPQKTG